MEEVSLKKPRLFFGLELSPDVRDFVVDAMNPLMEALAGVRWVRPENLHVTVKFLGWCSPDLIPDIEESMLDASEYFPVRLNIGGVGGFPSQGSARVLWVGVDDESGRLKKIHSTISKAVEKHGFSREKRAYRPHITVGRARKKPVRIGENLLKHDDRTMILDVDGISLFHSELLSTGARYTVIHRVGA